MRKIAALAALLLTGASCALFRSRPPLYPEGVVFPLAPARSLLLPGEITGEVVREGAVLYMATRSGSVLAVDAAVLRILWTCRAAESLRSPLYAGAHGFYVHDGETVSLIDRGGEAVWASAPGGAVTGGIFESGERAYVGLEKGVAALDVADGRVAWFFETPAAVASRPVAASGNIVFGCDDHRLYFIDRAGRRRGDLEVGGVIRGELLADEERVYFGSHDHTFYCADTGRRRLKWKVRSGGVISPRPVRDGNRIYFINQAGVLFCLHRKNGTVIWWRTIPARLSFRPEVIAGNVVVSALSDRILCFDAATGRPRGEFQAPNDAGANPVWISPQLGLVLTDPGGSGARLVFMKKQVGVSIRTGPEPPARMNQEIAVTADAVGFFMPMYEYSLTSLRMVRFGPAGQVPVEIESTRSVGREKSPEAAWSWFPEKTGFYKLSVLVEDEREKAEAHRLYRILPLTRRSDTEAEAGEKKAPDEKKTVKKSETGEKTESKKKPPTKKKEEKGD